MNDAAARALSMVGRGMYQLGSGGYHPRSVAGGIVDEPWGPDGGADCSRFAICWAHRMGGHLLGFNHGPWSTVSDDVSCDSAIEDALHRRQLFELVTTKPEPGDLLVYHSIWIDQHCVINDTGHGERRWIGHVAVIVKVPIVWLAGEYAALQVVQCRGPNGKRPGVVLTDGSVWDHHDHIWGDQPQRRSVILRVRDQTLDD